MKKAKNIAVVTRVATAEDFLHLIDVSVGYQLRQMKSSHRHIMLVADSEILAKCLATGLVIICHPRYAPNSIIGYAILMDEKTAKEIPANDNIMELIEAARNGKKHRNESLHKFERIQKSKKILVLSQLYIHEEYDQLHTFQKIREKIMLEKDADVDLILTESVAKIQYLQKTKSVDGFKTYTNTIEETKIVIY